MNNLVFLISTFIVELSRIGQIDTENRKNNWKQTEKNETGTEIKESTPL